MTVRAACELKTGEANRPIAGARMALCACDVAMPAAESEASCALIEAHGAPPVCFVVTALTLARSELVGVR